MDRKPKPAPFPVGTRLRYVGTLRVSREDGTPLLHEGMEGVVVEVRPGRQGTGRWIDLDDGEDDPIQDTTRDGYSVVELVSGWRRVASPESWERA